MNVDGRGTQAEARVGPPWLRTEVVDADVVVVTVIGGIAASRADDLWSDLENALELAAGGLVIADLTRVTAFDVHSIDALARVAQACVRRHSGLRALMKSGSPLAQYAQSCGLTRRLPTYSAIGAALTGCRPGLSYLRREA